MTATVTTNKPHLNDVVTVIRDPRHNLGKLFAADGSKSASVLVSQAFAVQRSVPGTSEMAALIKEVSDDPHAALINSCFPDVPVGEEFVILSEKEFTRRLGLKNRDEMLGVHAIKVGGKNFKAVGRFKENTRPSSWQAFDRDIDKHTPPEFAEKTYVAWLSDMDKLVPGISKSARIETLSSSSRVTRKGKPLGHGNGHTWVQFCDSGDIDRVRHAITVRAMELGLSWKKPRNSRSDPTKIVGYGIGTITDPSVLSSGRIVFIGKPTVASGLVVKPQQIKVTKGCRLDTASVTLPSASRIKEISTAAGFPLQVRRDSTLNPALYASDLTLATEIELPGGSVVTVNDALSNLPQGQKLRCQTPFRDSSSCAAFLSRGGDGKPFIHDSGTSTTHWLSDDASASLGFPRFDEQHMTFDEVMGTLKTLNSEEIEETWGPLTSPLGKADQERVMTYVKEKTSSTYPILRATLKEANSALHAAQVSARAAGRVMIEFHPEDVFKQAIQVETLIAANVPETSYFGFGGVLSQLLDKPLPYAHCVSDTDVNPPSVPALEPIDLVGMRALVEKVAVFQSSGMGGSNNIAVPLPIIDTLIRKKVHNAPTVNGLVTHPTVLLSGEILSRDGIHSGSGLLLHGATIPNVKAYNSQQAKLALKRIRTSFLEGFEFETANDADAAISALFTGVIRRILDLAPGYAFLAPIQSSGKTTLARIIHIILTGRDMPVSSFPEGNDEEMGKRMLAILMSSPALVCLDNITDGTTFRSSVLSMIMTSPVLRQRILQLSREAECPTNTLFIATGNNLALGADEVSRWLLVNLNPRSTRPQERTFRNHDVMAHAQRIREVVLRDVVGILAGYLTSGDRMTTLSRFTKWDRMVRQPLIWSGGLDVATVFQANAQNSESFGAPIAVLTALKAIFGTDEFRPSQVAGLLSYVDTSSGLSDKALLRDGLVALRCKDPGNDMSVGRVLAALINRRVSTVHGDLSLSRRALNGLAIYRVTNW